MDTITEAADDINQGKGSYSQTVKTNVPRMADMGNVPRNEKKFKNFLKNSLRVSRYHSISHHQNLLQVGCCSSTALSFSSMAQIYRDQDMDELWKFLETRRAQAAAATTATTSEVRPASPHHNNAYEITQLGRRQAP